jgi:hypothetical protein
MEKFCFFDNICYNIFMTCGDSSNLVSSIENGTEVSSGDFKTKAMDHLKQYWWIYVAVTIIILAVIGYCWWKGYFTKFLKDWGVIE